MGGLLLLVVLAAPAADDKLSIIEAFFEDPDGRVVRNLTLNAGDTNYFSFKIAGFRPDAKQRVLLAYHIDCLDPAGQKVIATLSEKVDATLAPQDERWQPKIPWQAVIPNYAPSGDYQLRVRVEDLIAKSEAAWQGVFKVRGETQPPEDKLAVRRFVFADQENGPAKPESVYKAPATLWARFKIVGFTITPEKEFWVEHDLTVLDEAGKELYKAPNAGGDEKHKQFYPPRVLSGEFNLDLQKGLKPGEYTIRLELRDKLGAQTAAHEARFRVE
jgi:hypothetical protein